MLQRGLVPSRIPAGIGSILMSLIQLGEIATSRLALIAITPAMLQSEQANDHRLGELIQCAISPNWPPVDWEPHVLDTLLTQFERYPEQVAWHRYVAFLNTNGSRTLIGTLCAFWRESYSHECEIGYSILPPYERRGLATEGTRALIDLLRKDARLTSVLATTFPSLA